MPNYTPDATELDRPQGGDRVAITAELRSIKQRVQDVDDEAMPKALPIQKVDPTGSAGKSTSGSNITVSLSGGSFQHFRVSRDSTFIFSVPTLEDGYVPFFTLRLTNAGAHNITWPEGTRWPLGIEPVLTSSGTDMLVFYQPFPGSHWEGVLVGSDMKVPS